MRRPETFPRTARLYVLVLRTSGGRREARTIAEHIKNRTCFAGPAIELHPRADLTGDNPKPIMFDFVQPRFAGWRVRGFGGQAGGDEAGRYAVHTLLIAYERRLRSRSAADSGAFQFPRCRFWQHVPALTRG
jgi:hypothetical protein